MAKDIFHNTVRQALEADGWLITHDPYRLSVLGREVQIDLGAEKVLMAAEKGMDRIVVEIKSFLNPSFTYDFHLALGQYLNYLLLLEEHEPDRLLFLAVSKSVYESEFDNLAVQKAIKRYSIHILVFDDSTKSIASWIK